MKRRIKHRAPRPLSTEETLAALRASNPAKDFDGFQAAVSSIRQPGFSDGFNDVARIINTLGFGHERRDRLTPWYGELLLACVSFSEDWTDEQLADVRDAAEASAHPLGRPIARRLAGVIAWRAYYGVTRPDHWSKQLVGWLLDARSGLPASVSATAEAGGIDEKVLAGQRLRELARHINDHQPDLGALVADKLCALDQIRDGEAMEANA